MSINLSGISAAQQAQKKRDKIVSRSIFVTLLSVFIVAGIFFGLSVYNKKLEQDIQSKDREINIESAKLSGSDAVRVINIAYRADDLQRYYTPDSLSFEILEAIGNSMVDSVVLDEYHYSVGNTVSIEAHFVSNDFVAVAQQVARLKQLEIFRSVTVSEIDRDMKAGAIHFIVQISLKENSSKNPINK